MNVYTVFSSVVGNLARFEFVVHTKICENELFLCTGPDLLNMSLRKLGFFLLFIQLVCIDPYGPMFPWMFLVVVVRRGDCNQLPSSLELLGYCLNVFNLF